MSLEVGQGTGLAVVRQTQVTRSPWVFGSTTWVNDGHATCRVGPLGWGQVWKGHGVTLRVFSQTLGSVEGLKPRDVPPAGPMSLRERLDPRPD